MRIVRDVKLSRMISEIAVSKVKLACEDYSEMYYAYITDDFRAILPFGTYIEIYTPDEYRAFNIDVE